MFGRGIGPPEIILILLIILLLFGAKKLPDLARGVGRSLRIFKAETKGLTEDDEGRELDAGASVTGRGGTRRRAGAAGHGSSPRSGGRCHRRASARSLTAAARGDCG